MAAGPDLKLAMSREVDDLKTTFDMLDRDGDGQLSPTDVRKSMSMFGKQVSVEEAQEFIEQVSSGEDRVREEKFLQWMKEESSGSQPEETLHNAFLAFDKDKDGFISKAELKAGFAMMGQHISDAMLDLMMEEADTDSDGKLNYQDFVHVMTR